MKIYCQYSGIEYQMPNFPNFRLQYVHPIFAAEPKHLLSRAGDWAANKYNEQERKLLFLALLHSTDLVEFRTAALPDDATVQKNMEALMRFVSWVTGIHTPAVSFPRFAISNETKHLPNVRHWIETWLEARKQFETGYKSQSQLAKMRQREGALERLIKSAGKKTEDYSGMLAAWALAASDAPKPLHEYWTSLFKLKGLDIYNAKTVDLEELVEHLEDRLEHGSIYAAATMKHVRLVLARNKAGLGFSLGIPTEELATLDLEKLANQPFKIVEDEISIYNKQVIAATAPEEQPVESAYPSRIAFLRAKAAYHLAQRAKEYAAEFTATVEQQIAADEEINNEAADNDETDESVGDDVGDDVTGEL